MSIFGKKTSILKKLTGLMAIFCQKKNLHSHKNTVLFMKNPLLQCPYLIQKKSVLSKKHYIMGQKVNKMPFFF